MSERDEAPDRIFLVPYNGDPESDLLDWTWSEYEDDLDAGVEYVRADLRAPVDPPERVSEQEPGWYRRVNVQQVSEASALREALEKIEDAALSAPDSESVLVLSEIAREARRALEDTKEEG